MSTATSARPIYLAALSWPAVSRGNVVDGYTIEAPDAPDDATLQAEVDAAPDADWREQQRTQVDQAIADAIALLDQLASAAALPTVPNGTMNNAQLSDALRMLRDGAQATRAGAQDVARILRDTIRLVRGDFDAPS